MSAAAKTLIVAGCALALAGVLLWASQSASWLRLGRLPGDIRVERPGFTLYVPITTMVLLSLAATAAWYALGRLRR